MDAVVIIALVIAVAVYAARGFASWTRWRQEQREWARHVRESWPDDGGDRRGRER